LFALLPTIFNVNLRIEQKMCVIIFQIFEDITVELNVLADEIFAPT
jgi:hypothetical protein